MAPMDPTCAAIANYFMLRLEPQLDTTLDAYAVFRSSQAEIFLQRQILTVAGLVKSSSYSIIRATTS